LVAAYAALTGFELSNDARDCLADGCFAAIFDIADKDRYIVSFYFEILDLIGVFYFVQVFNFIGILDLSCLTSHVRWQLLKPRPSKFRPLLLFLYSLLNLAYCGSHAGVGVCAFKNSKGAKTTDDD
jgi:hypothetical protein